MELPQRRLRRPLPVNVTLLVMLAPKGSHGCPNQAINEKSGIDLIGFADLEKSVGKTVCLRAAKRRKIVASGVGRELEAVEKEPRMGDA